MTNKAYVPTSKLASASQAVWAFFMGSMHPVGRRGAFDPVETSPPLMVYLAASNGMRVGPT